VICDHRAMATTKKKPTTPKVSPLRGTSVDDFAAKLPAWQQSLVAELRALVARVAPKVTVVIKWAQPVFEHHGPLAYIKPAAKHVSFGFWRGAELADPDQLLDGGDRMKHLKISEGSSLPKAKLEAWVRAAVKLNEAKGDPSKR
jgi:hypothetical protein